MSEITDLTAAVKALTAQLQKGTSKATAERNKEAVTQLEKQLELEDELSEARAKRAKDDQEILKERIALQEKAIANLKRRYQLQTDPEVQKDLKKQIVEYSKTLDGF